MSSDRDAAAVYSPRRNGQPPEPPTDDEVRDLLGRRSVDEVLEDTDLDRIKERIASLTYRNMKRLAAGILGSDAPPEAIITLADKLDAFSSNKVQA